MKKAFYWPQETQKTQKDLATKGTEVAKVGTVIQPWFVFAFFVLFVAINSEGLGDRAQARQSQPRKIRETQKSGKTGFATKGTEGAKVGIVIRPWIVFALFVLFVAIDPEGFGD